MRKQIRDGNEANWCLQGTEEFEENVCDGRGVRYVSVNADNIEAEVYAHEAVYDLEEHIEEVHEQYMNMSSAQWRCMTTRQQQEYLFNGLD